MACDSDVNKYIIENINGRFYWSVLTSSSQGQISTQQLGNLPCFFMGISGHIVYFRRQDFLLASYWSIVNVSTKLTITGNARQCLLDVELY